MKDWSKQGIVRFLLLFFHIVRGCCPSTVTVTFLLFYYRLYPVRRSAVASIIPLFYTVRPHPSAAPTMSSSPLLKKRKVMPSTKPKTPCVICTKSCDEKQKSPNPEHWEEFKQTAEAWENVRGKFSAIYSRISWDAGPEGVLWHKNCKWQIVLFVLKSSISV